MGDSKLCFEKYILFLENLMFQIDPLNISFSQKVQYLDKFKAISATK